MGLDFGDNLLPNPTEGVIKTLTDMDPVAWYGERLVIAPGTHLDVRLRENLAASVAASVMRLSSVDYTRRKYFQGRPVVEDEEYRLCVQVFRVCEQYLKEVKARLQPAPETDLGVFAASVALDRMAFSFSAAHILYSLGLNFEGDSVSRHILEQVAWAVNASSTNDENELSKLKSHDIGALRRVAPLAGPLYGFLSDNVHAGIDQHRQAFSVNQEGRGVVSLSWRRSYDSYLVLSRVAELWVVGFEWTQRDYLTTFSSVDPENNYKAVVNQEFWAELRPTFELLKKFGSTP